MSAVQRVDDTGAWTGRLTPSEVDNVLFTRAGIGRRGYEEGEVDGFLERVRNELARLIGEKVDLREEVDRLRARVKSAAGEARENARDEASSQAVRILSAAQQTADQYVAEAEHYSRRVSIETREQCDLMLDEARARSQEMLDAAKQAVEAAGVIETAGGTDGKAGGDTEQARQELEEQVSYLRTFSEVCRVQLRAYLEALLRDIEDEWGRAQPQVLEALPRLRDVDQRVAVSGATPAALPTHQSAQDELAAQDEQPSDIADGPGGAAVSEGRAQPPRDSVAGRVEEPAEVRLGKESLPVPAGAGSRS